jgi:Protein of unknown function (DUF3617)
MKWALIGSAAIVITGVCVGGSAWAVPVPPPRDTIAGEPSPLLLSVRYRHHYWHYRYYGYWRYRHSRWARNSTPERAAAGAVKPGRWEFTSRLQPAAKSQLPAGMQLPPGTQPESGGGIQTSYTSCIEPSKPVPAEIGPQCKIDSTDRDGANITWSMTCTNAQGAVRSDGVAQYSGDTMESTMISHLPGADGKVTDLAQHITGRYVGPCTTQPE